MQYLHACKQLPRRTLPLAADLYALIVFLNKSCNSDLLAAVGETELTLTQIKLLHHLEITERQLTLKEAAELVHVSLPAASRTVDDLVRRGFVARHEDACDRRMKRVSLTDTGRAVLIRLGAARLQGLEQFSASLSERERGVALRGPRPAARARRDRRLPTHRRPVVNQKILAHRHRLITDANRRWWTLGAMCFALFMIMLDNTVVNVALPSIQRDLHASLSALEWTINAYTLTFAVLLVTGGRLGDIFGRRKMFIFGVIVFGLASLVIGFAPNDAFLVAFRAVQGVGAAFMMPATLSIITQAFPAEERGTAIGMWAGVSALALAIGPVVGGFLTQDVSWRAIFFINPPIAAIAVAVTLFATRESRDETVSRKVDYAGIAALTIGLTALVLALVEGNAWHWGSPQIIALFATAAIALPAFLLIERRVDSPIIDFTFFRSRTSAGVNLVAFIVSFAMFAQMFFMTLYMQNVLHYSPLGTGVRFLPSTLMIVLIAPMAGRLADKIGSRPLMTVGLVIVAAAIFIQSHITVHSSYLMLLPGFVLMGIGMALTMSPMSTAAMNAVDRSKAGAASGVLSMSRMVGSTFGVAAMGAIVATIGRSKLDTSLPQLPAATRATIANALGSGAAPSGLHAPPVVVLAVKEAFVSALGTGLTVGVVVVLIGAALSFTLVRRTPPPEPEQASTHVPEHASEPAREPVGVDLAI